MTRRVVLLGLVLLALVVALGVVLYLRERPVATAGPRPAPAGSASAPAGPWYQVWFTSPKYPDRPADRHGGIDEQFVAFIDAARLSLDLAIYDFDLANVADALARARARGVEVRMVTDTDTINNTRDQQVQAALAKVREAGIPIVPDGRQAIMHHKFAVRDGGAGDHVPSNRLLRTIDDSGRMIWRSLAKQTRPVWPALAAPDDPGLRQSLIAPGA